MAAMAVSGLAGCIRFATDEVRVRDPHQVTVAGDDGAPVLPAGTEPATVGFSSGTRWDWFERIPYRTLLDRDDAGEVTLTCEGCWSAPPAFPRITLVSNAGTLGPVTHGALPWIPSPLLLGPERVELRMSMCLVTQGRGCAVRASPRLFTPWSNVIDIHRTRRTSKGLGAFLIAWSLAPTGAGAAVASIGGIDPRVRAAVATPLVALGTAILATGIWHVAASPIEERLDLSRPAGQ